MFKDPTSGSGSDLPDAELVKLYSGGSDSAFAVLTDRYIGLIRSITSKYRVAGLEPDDLTQEGLMGLLCAAKSYDSSGPASFRTYASLCINRRVISLLKRSESGKSKALNNYVSIDDEGCEAMSAGESPEDMYIGKESLSTLRSAVTKLLSQKERQVFGLYLAGESYAEISRTLGMNAKAVDNAMQRIRRKLRDHILSISL